ncbi:MAG: Stk1 family PASTA domain-containing Ser/Thr kinase [Carboxydocellales bacterium]
MDFLGKTLGKRYEIVEQLGGGGMALVYRARCNCLHREVTVKILRPQYTCDEDFVERFRREAQAVASLSHPNTVSVYDVGEEAGIHYIVMEYIDGKNLKELIREQGPLPIQVAVDYAHQICGGLEHAHERGIVHRDIKPHNILVTKGGRVKVTDFGIAKAVSSDTVTQAGTIIGSVQYISPEQAKGEPGGLRSDIYSVGIVLYEMLTGKLPFSGDSPIAMAMKHIQEEPIPPSCINAKVTPELEQVVLRAMAKSPERRYQTAREMANDLRTVLSGQISEATKLISVGDCPTMILSSTEELELAAAGEKAKKPAPKRRWIWIGAALLVVGLLIGGLFGLGSLFVKQEVKVPDMVGLTEDEAKTELNKVNLVLNVLGIQNNDKQPAGKIFYQNIDPNNTVKEGREIGVLVSQGPKLYPVPAVKNKPQEEAQLLINQSQMALGKITTRNDEKIAAGIVIEQNPDPEVEKEKPQGTKINLVVSKGPTPQFRPVPNVIGLTERDAMDAIAAANLKMAKIGEVESTEYFPGTVVLQDPPATAEQNIEEGSTINVTVSKGPGPAVKDYLLRIELSEDGQPHQIKIIVYDSKDPEGRIDSEQQYPSGETVVIPVKFYGTGKYEVYIDTHLAQKGSI